MELTLTALDKEGNVMDKYSTTTEHYLSELEVRLNALKRALCEGTIDHILIGRNE